MSEQNAFESLLVVELASVLAGPAVGMFFAELGARVIKVENPGTGGDVTRSWRGPAEDSGSPAAYYSSINWGKESVGIDLRTKDGREIVHDLVRHADVVLASYKAGDAVRLGVDHGTLAGMNPRLVYAEVTAYGDDDPRVGYDAVIQAETGFTSMNGTVESGPLKMPVALMDILAGHQLKEGILAALLERERTGFGRRVTVSLFEAGVTALANQASNYLMTGVVPAPLGSAHPNIVPYGSSYRCRDGGFVVLAVGTDRQFARLAECLDAAELASDPQFETNALRVRNRGELEARLSARVRQFDRDSLVARLREADVPAGGVRNVDEALLDPLAARLVLTDACGASAMRTIAFSVGDERPRSLGRPPPLSSHAYSVLTDLLGYRDDHVRRLAEAGAVLVEDQGGAE